MVSKKLGTKSIGFYSYRNKRKATFTVHFPNHTTGSRGSSMNSIHGCDSDLEIRPSRPRKLQVPKKTVFQVVLEQAGLIARTRRRRLYTAEKCSGANRCKFLTQYSQESIARVPAPRYTAVDCIRTYLPRQ
jgi:hypothetical protein